MILNVFICYRRDDGADLARWIHDSLSGKSLYVDRGVIKERATLSLYFDQSSPAAADWRKDNREALESATAFIVVCTPGVATRFPDRDEVYREIEWWLTNRPHPPIVVEPEMDHVYIPDIINSKWPALHRVALPRDVATASAGPHDHLIDLLVRSVGINVINQSTSSMNTMGIIGASPASPIGLHCWVKDRHSVYVNCNEEYARMAGFDSPKSMIGKSDFQMPWRALAEQFRSGDQGVMAGTISREHVQEKEITPNGEIPILVWELPLLDSRRECIGVIGHFVDLTGVSLAPRIPLNLADSPVCIGPQFDNEYVFAIEAKVLELFLHNLSPDRIAAVLSISRPEVESHLSSLKKKLQCEADTDLAPTAIQSGLPLLLFGPTAIKQ